MFLKRNYRERLGLFLFILPALLILIFSQVYPLLHSLVTSFQSWNLAQSMTPLGFAGFQNYIEAFKDPLFANAARISVLFSIASTTATILFGFILAYFTVGERFVFRLARSLLVIPIAIAPVASGTLWRMILNSRSGLLNQFLGFAGIKGPAWFGTPELALLSVIMVDIWQFTPFAIVVFSAGFTIIPKELYDAAAIDGAGRFKILRYIILPHMVPITFIVLLFRVVDSLLVLGAVMTTTFGGPGFSTNVISLYIYWQALRYYKLSYGAALSWILNIVMVLIALFLLRLQRRIHD
jgi:ABC-type sugar transport system permease subunit